MEAKVSSQKELEKCVMRDINQLRQNIKEKVCELVERGCDLDELFYEMRDDEEIKYEKD